MLARKALIHGGQLLNCFLACARSLHQRQNDQRVAELPGVPASDNETELFEFCSQLNQAFPNCRLFAFAFTSLFQSLIQTLQTFAESADQSQELVQLVYLVESGRSRRGVDYVCFERLL